MSVFTDELTVTELPDWKIWRLETDLVYEVGAEGSGKVITVPKGFITDGASVPRALWALFPSWGTYSRAAVVHDMLCHDLNRGTPHALAPTRKDADTIFLEAMKVCGTNWFTRTVLYVGVRIGSLKLLGRTNIVDRVNQDD